MRFAWSSPQLEGCCASHARLRDAAGEQIAAVEDLLQVVSQVPRLEDFESFRSLRINFHRGNLTFSIEEVDMHVRPLSPVGVPHVLVGRASLHDHALCQALLIQDLYVRGQSILRLAS